MYVPACILVFLLHRHGMRHPFEYFEGIGDPVPQEQLGLLTEKGERQMSALGKHLAAKHDPGSPVRGPVEVTLERVNPEAISSSVSRCKESSKIIFKNFLNKTVDASVMKTDYSMLYKEMIVRNIEPMMSREFTTDQGSRVSDYINFLNERANSSKKTMEEKYQIVESLLTAMKNGHDLPPYADERTLEECLNVMNRQLIEGYRGKLAAEIVEDMATRLSDLPNAPSNFVEYSVSDIHVVSVLERLGCSIQGWPDYGSAYEIRIHEDGYVGLDAINNSADAKITERTAIKSTTVQRLRHFL